IKEPSFAKQFPNITSCALTEMIEEPIGNQIVGTYLVQWNLKKGYNEEPLGFKYRIDFLKALNKGKADCMFNGFWVYPEE
ncbi:hypothetical protein CRM22_010980, partial [Opisthorchis felineus]